MQDCRWQAPIGFGLLVAHAFAILGCSIRGTNTVAHVVIILKENHTFNDYFGTFPGADGATTGITSIGSTVPLMPMPDADQAQLSNLSRFRQLLPWNPAFLGGVCLHETAIHRQVLAFDQSHCDALPYDLFKRLLEQLRLRMD